MAWDPGVHPRDRKGRFIEHHSLVKVFDSITKGLKGEGHVEGMAPNGRLDVRMRDGSRASGVHPDDLEVISEVAHLPSSGGGHGLSPDHLDAASKALNDNLRGLEHDEPRIANDGGVQDAAGAVHHAFESLRDNPNADAKSVLDDAQSKVDATGIAGGEPYQKSAHSDIQSALDEIKKMYDEVNRGQTAAAHNSGARMSENRAVRPPRNVVEAATRYQTSELARALADGPVTRETLERVLADPFDAFGAREWARRTLENLDKADANGATTAGGEETPQPVSATNIDAAVVTTNGPYAPATTTTAAPGTLWVTPGTGGTVTSAGGITIFPSNPSPMALPVPDDSSPVPSDVPVDDSLPADDLEPPAAGPDDENADALGGSDQIPDGARCWALPVPPAEDEEDQEDVLNPQVQTIIVQLPGVTDDEEGTWLYREDGAWQPMPALDADDGFGLIPLSPEDANSLLTDLDDQGTDNPSIPLDEERLHSVAEPEVDWDTVDKLFHRTPFSPGADDLGDEEQPYPSALYADAAAQPRDTNGRWVKVGGSVTLGDGSTGMVTAVNSDGTIVVQDANGATQNVSAGDVTVNDDASAPASADNAGAAPASTDDTPADGGSGDATAAPANPDQVARLDNKPDLVKDVPKALKGYLDAAKKQLDAMPKPDDSGASDNAGDGGTSATPAQAAPAASDVPTASVRELADAATPPAVGPNAPFADPNAPVAPAAAPAATPATPADDSGDGTDTNVGITPDNSPVAPLYLAEVDTNDTQAVLDVFALIPNSDATDLELFKRTGGAWQPDTEDLTAIQGATPPPLVELDDATLQNVLGQMDTTGADASGAGDGATPVPSPDAVPAGDGSVPVTAAGALVEGLSASQTYGAVLLASYDSDPDGWPTWIVDELDELQSGGADRNRGNAERLRRYWEHGEGAAKIRWGEPNDWYRCVSHLSKYMGPRSKGYCALRHKGATGFWPGHAPTEQRPHGRK